MNQSKRILTIFFSILIMLSSIFPAYAINFDAETTYNSIFVIHSGNSLGSGFAISENRIITNAHVISIAATTYITTYDGENYSASISAIDTGLDIAVLDVDGVSFVPLETANYEEISIGDDVYAIGAPKSLSFTLTKGCLSAKERKVGSHYFIQTDAAINAGNSGGPLLDNNGKVIGVNTYKMSDAEGIGLAIPISSVLAFLYDTQPETSEGDHEPSHPKEETNPLPTPPQENPQGSDQTPITETFSSFGLIIAFVVSVALNIILVILLLRQKKKSAYLIAYDAKGRTDFEIEILE